MKRRLVWLFLLLTGLLAVAAAFYLFHGLPSLDSLDAGLARPSIRITDRRGTILYEILPERGGRNAVLPLDSIPACMKDATISVEDRNFYENPGVDVEGIVRALWINLHGGETLAGGSTITQQVARTLLFSPEERGERSLRRKLREALLAWQLARRLSKDEILALYLNQTYYGGFAFGVEAASQTYFGKPAADLLLHECALLAGLPQAPSLYDPFTDPEAARERQRVVLELMEKNGYITARERSVAEATPLAYNGSPYPILAPHFVWMVKGQLDRLFEDGVLFPRQSLIVRTTLDLDHQRIAEDIIHRRLESYAPKAGQLNQNVNNAALVALDPHSGEILALVGSADYFDAGIDGAVNMAAAPRQSGSAFKPFIYALALSPGEGSSWTAATPLLDVTTTFITHDGAPYIPKNYDDLEHGPVPVREALASSLNIPAVLTLQHVGIPRALNLAHRLGIDSLDQNPDHYDLSLALGGGQMSLLELTSAFSTFADGGLYPGRTSILEIRDFAGNLLFSGSGRPAVQVLDPRVAWLISDILSDDSARRVGFGRNSTLKLDRTAAVKTGTTTNYHDNWTVGYTPDLVAGVWVGNSNYQAMHNVTGLTGAAPIWHTYMRTVLAGTPDTPFLPPPGMSELRVCTLSGLLPGPACPNTRLEWFIQGTEPTGTDTLYKEIWVDTGTGRLADIATPQDRRQPVVAMDLPASAVRWAQENGIPLLSQFSQSSQSANGRLTLLSPASETIYRLARDFDPAAQQILISFAAARDFSRVSLLLDGRLLAVFTGPPFETWWPPVPGEHFIQLQAAGSDGGILTSEPVHFTVLPPE
ncbi:MAG TPA: penicillin-binding protein 1C [Anaerolineales bacterium]